MFENILRKNNNIELTLDWEGLSFESLEKFYKLKYVNANVPPRRLKFMDEN